MSARPSIYVSIRRPADGGKSPNAYLPFITAELRLFYPDGSLDGLMEVTDALDAVYAEARAKIDLLEAGVE